MMWKVLERRLEDIFYSASKYVERGYNKIITNDKRALLVLIFLAILIQIPGFITYDFDDPGYDSVYILEGAKNIKDGKGYQYDSLWFFDRFDGRERFEITKPGYLYPPLTSILIAGVFMLHESIFAAILFQFFLYLILIPLYYRWVKKLFDPTIAFLSTLFLIFNPMLYAEVLTPPRSHILGLILLMAFLNILIKKNSTNKPNIMFLAGITGGLAYLTRDIYLLLLIVWGGKLFFTKHFKGFFPFSFGFLGVSFPWWYRNWNYYGTMNPRATTTGYHYPPALSHPATLLSNITPHNILQAGYNLWMAFMDMATPYLFFILFPFVLVGMAEYVLIRKQHRLIILLCAVIFFIGVISCLIAGDTNYQPIYLLPTYLLLLPIGIYTLRKYMRSSFLLNNLDLNYATSLFIAFLLLVSGLTIIRETGRRAMAEPDPEENYSWAGENLPLEAKVLVGGQPSRFHYFTDREAVILPTNLNEYWFERFITDYNITHVYIREEVWNWLSTMKHWTEFDYDMSVFPYNELFNGTIQIKGERVILNRIHEESAYPHSHYRIWVYEVIWL